MCTLEGHLKKMSYNVWLNTDSGVTDVGKQQQEKGIQKKHTFVSLPIYVPGKFYDISGHWQRLLVNLSDLIKYIYNKNHLGGEKNGGADSLS